MQKAEWLTPVLPLFTCSIQKTEAPLHMPEPHEGFTIKTIFRPWQRQLRVPYPENQIHQHRIRLRLTIYGARHNHKQPTTLGYFNIKFWKKNCSSRCHSHEGWRNLLSQTALYELKTQNKLLKSTCNFIDKPAITLQWRRLLHAMASKSLNEDYKWILKWLTPRILGKKVNYDFDNREEEEHVKKVELSRLTS